MAADELLAGRGPGLKVRALAGAAVLALLLVVAHLSGLDAHLADLLRLARGAGPRGVLLHVLAYVAAALLGLPATPLTLAAGAAHGPLLGALLAVPAVTLAACGPFLVGRAIARDPAALAAGKSRLARTVRALGDTGVRVVVLLRLAPIVPFSILNFAFGATPTRLTHFAAGTFLGTIPSQLGAALLGEVLTWPPGAERTRAEAALVVAAAVLSVAATAAAFAALRRLSAQALAAAAAEPPPGPPARS